MQKAQTRTQRQHFLPQFLLKGFASRVRRDAYYVYLFREGREPCEVNIINVGLTRNFYESPKSGGLESKLSVQEGRYAPLLESLRGGVVDQTQMELIDDFVCNLMVRTKHLRDAFKDTGESALDYLEQQFGDPQNRGSLEQLMIEQALENPELRRLLKPLPRKQRKKFISRALSKLDFDVPATFRLLLELARKHVNMDQVVKDAQVKALAIGDTLAKRKESLRSFRWRVEEKPPGTLVLGDVGPVACFPDSLELKPPVGFGTPEVISLPISDRHLLVGEEKGGRESVDVEELNLASVELSRDFFIASRKTPRELGYLERIGRRAKLLDEAEIDQSIQEALRGK